MKIERQLQGTLNTIFTELIKERQLENRILPYSVQEEGRADITLKDQNGKPIFFIELKDPTAKDGKSVFDSGVLMREMERAQKLEIKYFGNCNFLACAFFDKDKIYEKVSVNEGFFTIRDIERLSVNYSPNKEMLTRLRSIATFYIERAIEILENKTIRFSPLDELFIFKIRKFIEVYSYPITEKVWETYKSNKAFEKEIQKYTQSQLWNKPSTFEEIENLTLISVLMLISKLIFYKAYVDNQTWHELHPMEVPDSIKTTEQLENHIWNYFEQFQIVTGNFELLIGNRSDIIFRIPFLSESVMDLTCDILDTENKYDFSKIPFDIIGRIFEELIRDDERHKLGQYFTPPHVIDFILAFTIRDKHDRIFDPSCGSGTFLVRAYENKKNLLEGETPNAKHDILLSEIYGNDLSGYPAYLSMLNLAIRNTSRPSYPRIINHDFFSILEKTSIPLHNQKGKIEKSPLPKFDVIIGNPPYTRQEDIGTMHGTVSKLKIQALIKSECGFEPSMRTSIYAYFFYHASVFLKDGGYLGFICQNSWLDTDYGVDMQRYLLNHFEIIAIVDSAVERFFPSASVNTTIVILKKQSKDEVRDSNLVRFIYFNSKLSDALSHFKGPLHLKNSLFEKDENVENEFFNINCVSQDLLSGYSKWGQFLKAPKVYFDILDRGGKLFIPLNSLAEVKFGIKTGCNEFFILKDVTETISESKIGAIINNMFELNSVGRIRNKNLRIIENGYNELWLIEKDFIKPMLTSPKDLPTYSARPEDLPYSILMVHQDKKGLKKSAPFVHSYIEYGERKLLNHRSSLDSRKRWFDIGDRTLPDLSFNYIISDFGKTFMVAAFAVNNFHNIFAKQKVKTIWLYLNSTICWLIQQLVMRNNLGDGAGKIETYDLADLLIPDIDLEKLDTDLGETKSFKGELGSLTSLKTVNPERLKLDNEILKQVGFESQKERNEVLLDLYKNTYRIIEARALKAQSLKGVKTQRNKVEFSVYVDQLKTLLLDGKHEAKNTRKFAGTLEKLVKEITSENKLQKKILDSYWKEKYGQRFDTDEIASQDQIKLF